MKKSFSEQNYLRKKAKIAIIENDGLFTTQDFADYLEINIGSYYNWLSGAYDLSIKKAKKLDELLIDLVDQ